MTPDEQLKTAMADLINQTVTNMSSLQGWSLGQLPDVIHQLIMWNIVASIGWMLVAIGITYLGWKPISNFFERMKEEVRSGRGIADAMRAGFDRAWSSIFDSNFTTLGTAVILFWLGVSVIKGFALTLIIGILASLFSAYVVTRIFLYSFGTPKTNKFTGFLFGSGMSSARGK